MKNPVWCCVLQTEGLEPAKALQSSDQPVTIKSLAPVFQHNVRFLHKRSILHCSSMETSSSTVVLSSTPTDAFARRNSLLCFSLRNNLSSVSQSVYRLASFEPHLVKFDVHLVIMCERDTEKAPPYVTST